MTQAALYRTYGHLKDEFEAPPGRLRAEGHQPDPRAAQILRLTDENARLRRRLAERDVDVSELNEFTTTAVSRLAAQHLEILRLREASATARRGRALPGATAHPASASSSTSTSIGR
jgi:hypothetical protein